MEKVYDPSTDPKKIRCIKGDRVEYFNRQTAERPSWQKSTGWTPQEIAAEAKAPKSKVFGVDLNWKMVSHESDLSQILKPEEVLFIGTKEECKEFIKGKPDDAVLTYGVNKDFDLLTPGALKSTNKKDVLFKGIYQDCEAFITKNKPTE